MVVFVLISSIRLIKYPSEIDSNLSHPSKHPFVIAVVRPWPVFVVPLINIVIYSELSGGFVPMCTSAIRCSNQNCALIMTVSIKPRPITIPVRSQSIYIRSTSNYFYLLRTMKFICLSRLRGNLFIY